MSTKVGVKLRVMLGLQFRVREIVERGCCWLRENKGKQRRLPVFRVLSEQV
jgi:hypothetical protein